MHHRPITFQSAIWTTPAPVSPSRLTGFGRSKTTCPPMSSRQELHGYDTSSTSANTVLEPIVYNTSGEKRSSPCFAAHNFPCPPPVSVGIPARHPFLIGASTIVTSFRLFSESMYKLLVVPDLLDQATVVDLVVPTTRRSLNCRSECDEGLSLSAAVVIPQNNMSWIFCLPCLFISYRLVAEC